MLQGGETKKVEESLRPEQPRVRKEGEERGESNNVVWFIEKMRGRAGGSRDENVELLLLGVSRMNRIRIESIRGTVSVRSQRSGQGGLDVSTGWDAEAEPADLSTTEALTEDRSELTGRRPGGSPEKRSCGWSDRGHECEKRGWGQKEAGDWLCSRPKGRAGGRRGG